MRECNEKEGLMVSNSGKCVVCGKETFKVLFRKAIVPTFICSRECLRRYFEPIGGVTTQEKLGEADSWLD